MPRLPLVLTLLLAAACSRTGSGTDRAAERAPAEKPRARLSGKSEGAPTSADVRPTALVELFTSQGCSSCPPADDVLASLAERDDGVIALSLHVDYWNRLGWRDPYSDGAHSQHQRSYAKALGTNRVYTPQVVVGGREEMVGSRRSSVLDAVKRELGRAPAVPVSVTVRERGGSLEAAYVLSTKRESLRADFALVQDRASDRVSRGENAGHTLAHRNVVRLLQISRDPERRGTWTVALPGDLPASRAAVVVIARDPDSMAVLGAARAAP